MLEYLSIIEDKGSCILGNRANLPQFNYSPNLRFLYWVDNLYLPHVPFSRDVDAARIEEFTLPNSWEWVVSDITFIAQFSGLRMLVLESDTTKEIYMPPDFDENYPMAELPSLEILVLSGEVPNLLLQSLVVHILKTLKSRAKNGMQRH
jgi:hypothetical protein